MCDRSAAKGYLLLCLLPRNLWIRDRVLAHLIESIFNPRIFRDFIYLNIPPTSFVPDMLSIFTENVRKLIQLLRKVSIFKSILNTVNPSFFVLNVTTYVKAQLLSTNSLYYKQKWSKYLFQTERHIQRRK